MKKICIDIKIRSLYADTICRRSNIMQSHWQNREREVNFSALSFNCPARQASRCNDRVNRIKSESNVQKFKFVFQCNLQFITVAGLPFVMEIGSFYKLKANAPTTKLSPVVTKRVSEESDIVSEVCGWMIFFSHKQFLTAAKNCVRKLLLISALDISLFLFFKLYLFRIYLFHCKKYRCSNSLKIHSNFEIQNNIKKR